MTGDKAVFSKKNIFIRCQSSSLLVSNSSSSAGVILNEIMELIKNPNRCHLTNLSGTNFDFYVQFFQSFGRILGKSITFMGYSANDRIGKI